MFGTSLTINEGLIQDFLKNSVAFENEADDLMIHYLNKNDLDKQPIFDFLDDLSKNNLDDSYRRTHPTINDRKKKVLNHITVGNKLIRNNKFTYLKAKYFMNSENEDYNNFFKNIKNGKYIKIKDTEFKKIFEYELFKVGMSQKNAIDTYNSIIKTFDNSYVKLEFLNHLIDNDYYELLSKNINIYKNNENIKNEFYYLYIMGKAYDYLNQENESFFYFCNFYKKNNIMRLTDYYCNKYDRNKINLIDLVNEINVDINQ
jgi:predicted Zn-dependent protease